MARVRVAFASKDYVSGQQVRFKVYDDDNSLIYQGFGTEWANTGVYYVEGDLNFWFGQTYLVMAEEVTGNWKASKIVTRQDVI
jgi:hypothetical protein